SLVPGDAEQLCMRLFAIVHHTIDFPALQFFLQAESSLISLDNEKPPSFSKRYSITFLMSFLMMDSTSSVLVKTKFYDFRKNKILLYKCGKLLSF
ncbi:hypothetical protein STEG23_025009, partial [Scotinomys teguina]